ncbi:hemerythrin domain-containing protein [Maledivibacter halophilus]|uniref:Hemerythrin-like domain-containing protein n=1 Tax=Maledivibacter halophilus TaxID=36842 RepID=A0A1T5JAZ7_9FIRM|nr:hemerythrin domain-containing protein [Maledivibacter halophilus]SKC48707.1 Hemerythrin-like domain-containing protein [Maledivibacter halophilus]
MDAITLMIEEHKNIKKVLRVARKLCINILNRGEVNYEAFNIVVDFVKNYADKHHHNKEEDILFKKMSEELGEEIERGSIYGMFAEHDMGRLYMKNLVEALDRVNNGDDDSKVDIIANTISYTDLLHRHIDKEDNAIYEFGKRNLSMEAMLEVEERCREVEDIAKEKNIQKKYIKAIEELEKMV